jgi:RNA polymerase sigma-70 factor (ECF subfamily)
MNERDLLAERIEGHRAHLQAVAYRMLGSASEADDAVQEAWIRLSRTDTSAVDNLGGWLTTVVARVCLDMLRSRSARREEPWDAHVPERVESIERGIDPEYEAVLADSVGLALQVVLDTLAPAERLAFVMHDMFDVPFDDIASMVGRTPDAARQLASRARRRVHRVAPTPDPDLAQQRQVVNAFFAAARGGDFGALVAVLDPDVVLRSDGGVSRPKLSRSVRGAEAVARSAQAGALPTAVLMPVLINGAAGVIVLVNGRPFTVMAFTVSNGKVAEIDVIADPERLSQLNLDLSMA